jgi:DNA-binding response OmpR family regulator
MTNPKTIALIEDDTTILTMYQIKFESEGFKVHAAGNGRTGVELVTRKRPDVILLDINMPEMNGVEALKHIRKLPGGQEVIVVMLTNLGKEEAPQELNRLGVKEYITKADLTPRQVVERIKDILGVLKEDATARA